MIKIISHIYFRFPPIVRRAVNISLSGCFSGIGVDFAHHINDEHLLLGANELLGKKLFV